MSIRVLFADDQIPFNDPERDDAVREEICKEFETHRGKDRNSTAAGFDDDHSFFKNLLKFLISERGIDVIKIQSFHDAMALIESYDPRHIEDEEKKIDAAIIDLSWWGDKKLDSGHEGRHNKGYKLLECARAKFEKEGIFIPCIAYSQNFYDEPSIMGEVLKRGALPIPKLNRKEDDENKRQMGYEALFSAIEHLKEVQPINDVRKRMMLRFEKDMQRKSRNFEYILYGVLGVIVLISVLTVFKPVGQSVTTGVIQALIGGGGASLLGWAWLDQRASRIEFSKITKAIGITK